MNKKVLQTESVINELKGQSVYFPKDSLDDNPPPASSDPDIQKVENTRTNQSLPKPDLENKIDPSITNPQSQSSDLQSKGQDDMLSEQASSHASMLASTLASNEDDIVETIRKTVKQVGGKLLFIRLTPEEKHEITSLVFTFNELHRGESRKTSENEIGRIALNLLFVDYRVRGHASILAKVLAALVA